MRLAMSRVIAGLAGLSPRIVTGDLCSWRFSVGLIRLVVGFCIRCESITARSGPARTRVTPVTSDENRTRGPAESRSKPGRSISGIQRPVQSSSIRSRRGV